jgi:hypothetical protein
MSKIKKLRDNLPFISLAILIFSLLRMYFYYKTFNTTITDYIDLGEAVILSFEDYVPLIFFATIAIFFLYFAQNSKTYKNNNATTFRRLTRPNKFSHRLTLFTSYSGGFLSIVPIGVCMFSIPFIWIDIELAKFIAIIASFLFFYTYHPLLIYEISRQKKILTGNHLSNFTIQTASVVILLAYFTCFNIYTDSVKTLRSQNYKKAFIGMGKKVIMSTDNFRFVGKTKDYIFFYDKKKKVSKIYPLEKIDSLSIE